MLRTVLYCSLEPFLYLLLLFDPGVPKDANPKDIKKAYYQLAKKFHPDTNRGNTETQKKFQEVSEAYECLSDDTKRKQVMLGASCTEGISMQWESEYLIVVSFGRLTAFYVVLVPVINLVIQ